MKNTQQPVVDEEEKPTEIKVYDITDLADFESKNLYSSVGKMTLSSKPSAPCFGFGTSNRQKQAKVYQSEELSKTHFIGKTSPGPNYEVRHTDKFTYDTDPTWSFGKEVKNILNSTGPKHAYYNRVDDDFDPVQADNARKTRAAGVKIGLESRFINSDQKHKATPGPEYDPSLKPEIPNAPLYTFGARREVKGMSPLVPPTSTPNQVGPGSYVKLDQGNTSIMPDHPEFSFPKDQKLRNQTGALQKNQTYDTRSSLGDQVSSKNNSNAQISIGKAKKDVQTGMFKDTMSTQVTRIRIAHPRF